jgi:hypothetical protein
VHAARASRTYARVHSDCWTRQAIRSRCSPRCWRSNQSPVRPEWLTAAPTHPARAHVTLHRSRREPPLTSVSRDNGSGANSSSSSITGAGAGVVVVVVVVAPFGANRGDESGEVVGESVGGGGTSAAGADMRASNEARSRVVAPLGARTTGLLASSVAARCLGDKTACDDAGRAIGANAGTRGLLGGTMPLPALLTFAVASARSSIDGDEDCLTSVVPAINDLAFRADCLLAVALSLAAAARPRSRGDSGGGDVGFTIGTSDATRLDHAAWSVDPCLAASPPADRALAAEGLSVFFATPSSRLNDCIALKSIVVDACFACAVAAIGFDRGAADFG